MRIIAVLMALVFSGGASAANYVWKITFDSSHIYSGSSPLAAFKVYHQDRWPGWPYEITNTAWDGPTKYVFTFRNKRPADPAGTWANPSLTSTAVRSGDSCKAGTTYNTSTGACDDNCASTAGLIEYHLSATGKTRASSSESWPPGDVTGAPTMCANSCRYELAQADTLKCGSMKGGDPLVQFCLFKYSGMGTACSSDPQQNLGTTAPVAPTDPNDPTDPANNCGPTHVWSGSTCVAKLDDDPSTNPGDGGGGDEGGGGDDGGGDGGDDGGGTGDGDGDGDGDTGGGSGDGDSDSEVAGEACNLDLDCKGDAIQCAILRQQKTDRCSWELNKEVQDDIVESFEGEEYELQEESVDVGGGFTAGLSAPRFLSASCPAPVTFSVRGKSYSLKWNYVCDFASGLSTLIVGMAALFFAIYVGRGFGGD